MDKFIICKEKYSAKGVSIMDSLHYIQEGEKPSKVYIDFLKLKHAMERNLGLTRTNSTLEENLSIVWNMFGFKNRFLPYP